jgi:hypothetical protein
MSITKQDYFDIGYTPKMQRARTYIGYTRARRGLQK